MKNFFYFLAIVVLAGSSVNAAVLVVTDAGGSGPGSFREIVANALPGDEIRFDPSLDGQEIQGGVTITTDLTITGRGNDKTILSGGGPVLKIEEGLTVTLSDLSVTKGRARASAGIFIGQESFVSVQRCNIEHNIASHYNGWPSAFAAGGGIGIGIDSEVTIKDTVIANNMAIASSHEIAASLGGGIVASWGSSVTIENSIIRNNTAMTNGGYGNSFGGGIASEGAVELLRSTVTGNRATPPVAGRGAAVAGGIHCQGLLTIRFSEVSYNRADKYNQTFSRSGGINSSSSIGAVTVVTNSTISNNFAPSCGGMLSNGVIASSTFFENGESSDICSDGDLSIANSILNGDCDPDGAITSLGHNISRGDTCGLDQATDSPNTDPMLGPLQDNGGPTLTHEPLEGSPVIDTGWCEPGFDQRGVPRPLDGNRDNVWICDVGAVEYVPLEYEPIGHGSGGGEIVLPGAGMN